MPSDNGSVISHAALMSGLTVVAGSLRNASAVARWLTGRFATVGLVPAGEQWPDGAMRVCYEDLIGAGAIAAGMLDLGGDVLDVAGGAGGGGRLPSPGVAGRGRRRAASWSSAASPTTSRLAEEVDADDVVPVLRDGRYVAAD